MTIPRLAPLAAAALIAAAFAAPSRAEVVSFSTAGTFAAGSSGGLVDGDGDAISFLDEDLAVILGYSAAPATSVATPGAAGLGSFTLTVGGAGDRVLEVADASFRLEVDQSAPGAAAGSLEGTLSGTVGLDAGGLVTGFLTLSFAEEGLGLGPIAYELLGLAGPSAGLSSRSLVLVAGEGVGVTTGLNATITAVPTPQSLVLSSLGLGTVGLGMLGWSRRRPA